MRDSWRKSISRLFPLEKNKIVSVGIPKEEFPIAPGLILWLSGGLQTLGKKFLIKLVHAVHA